LSHAYERTRSNYVFRQGAVNNYIANQKEIIAYLSEVRPTCMVSVPRLYEKIYATVYDQVEKTGGLKKTLFNWAVATGIQYAYKKKDGELVGPILSTKHALADKLVLGKLRDVVGGYKKFFSAGGAALAKDIEEFFFACGVLICQGYGLTETSPMSTCNRPGEYKFGTVGKAVLECAIRVSDEGELQIKGPNLMKGYYNKPQATAEVFTTDGWFKTGDVGIIDEEGYIRITDRIKDLIITSQGKNIAPQHIEGVVGLDHYIEQVATIGDKRNYITALVVPSFEALEKYAKDNNIAFANREELVRHPEVVAFYRDRIDRQSAELANYEKIKRFTLMSQEFTQDGGELTPTLKLKRKVVMNKYADVIEHMYAGKDSD
jgi:long-chain acyl-CoA synthetase